MHRRIPMWAVIAAAAMSASCAASAEDDVKPPPAPIAASPPRKPVPIPSSAPPEGKLVTAEVPPDLIEKMRADLAEHAGIAASAAKVVTAESIVWPNGAIGCPQPGQMYTQATVPGYRVELEYNGRVYAYHAAQRGGFFKRCDNPQRAVGADIR
jgi:hypothetical protein